MKQIGNILPIYFKVTYAPLHTQHAVLNLLPYYTYHTVPTTPTSTLYTCNIPNLVSDAAITIQ